MRAEIQRLAGKYQFFHWHLEFPDVFHVPEGREQADDEAAGWSGGFDVVLGNPPWERAKIQEKEWFAERSPEIAKAPNAAARKRLINGLESRDPDLLRLFSADMRRADGESHLLRNSGRYPLCGRGDINLYAVFAEHMRAIAAVKGRAGFIVPSGIATDNTMKYYFACIAAGRQLVSLYDFQSGPGLFAEIRHARFKFSLLTLASHADNADLLFFARSVDDLRDGTRISR